MSEGAIAIMNGPWVNVCGLTLTNQSANSLHGKRNQTKKQVSHQPFRTFLLENNKHAEMVVRNKLQENEQAIHVGQSELIPNQIDYEWNNTDESQLFEYCIKWQV